MFKKNYLILFILFILTIPLISQSQSTITFVQITDTHISSPESQQRLHALLQDINSLLRKPVFIVNTGDITELGSPKEFQAYLEVVSSSDIPFYHVIGNHDVRWSNVGKRRFEQMLGPLYQSFDYGPVHFIMLDSGMLLEQYGHFSLLQLQWLEQDLKKVGTEKPIILCAHHPLCWNPRMVDNEMDLLKLIDKYNVIFYLCGHGHQNKHWELNGIDFLMTQALKSDTPGYRIIEIHPDGTVSVFLRDILTKKTLLDFTRDLQRDVLPVNFYLRSPNDKKSYQENLPILLTLNKNLKVKASLNGTDWKALQKSGSKHFENIDIMHLSEGLHSLYLKFFTDNDNSHVELVNFEIDRGETQLLYRISTEGEIQSSPVLSDNLLFVGSNDGNLYAFDKEKGIKRWQFSTKRPIVATPAVVEDTVFITSGDGYCYGISAKSGKKIWQQQAGKSIFSSPCYADGKIYFGSSDSCLYALKSNNGEILWKYQTNGYIKAKPAVEGNYVVVGSWDGYFYCLSTVDGQLQWKKQITENIYYSAATSNPVIEIDKIFVASHDHTVHAYNLANGETIWEHPKTSTQQPGYSSPIDFDDKVVFGSLTGHLFALSEINGKNIWTTTLADSLDPIFDSSPALNYPDVTVGSINGILYGVDFRDGNKLWSHKLTNGYIFSSPAIKGDNVYVGSTDGYLYALKILKK